MDRRSKVDNRSNSKQFENDDPKAKEDALNRLRQMEFLRNKQDSWHLSRSSARQYDVQERKRDEDDYFEGTGRDKNKRNRRPRHMDNGKPTIPPGFTVSSGPSKPPPVNAWSQKKGSSLFNKPPEEIDEEDEMLKLALRESMKTAEEEEKRKFEQLRQYKMGDTTAKGINSPEDEWGNHTGNDYSSGAYHFDEQFKSQNFEYQAEDDPNIQKEDLSSEYLNPNNAAAKPLHFVDTDVGEDSSSFTSRRKPFPRPRKSSSPSVSATKSESSKPAQSALTTGPFTQRNRFSHKTDNSDEEVFEPSRPFEIDNASNEKTNSFGVTKAQSVTEKYIDNSENRDGYLNNLAGSFKSTLTFGDTKDILGDLQLHGIVYNQKADTVNHSDDSSLNQTKKGDEQDLQQIMKPLTKTNESRFSGPSETDIILNRVIRQDPPSTVVHNIDVFGNQEQPQLFPSVSSQQLFSSNPSALQQALINGPLTSISQSVLHTGNGDGGYSSSSNSPIQNNSPYGSVEKHLASSITSNWNFPSQSAQLPLQFPLNLKGSFDTSKSLPENTDQSRSFPEVQAATTSAAQAPLQNSPTGYVPSSVPLGLPINPQLPILTQHQMPVPNMMMPPLQGQDLLNSSQIYQAQLQQQYQMAMMKAMQQQYQQQLNSHQQPVALGLHAPENHELHQKEQTNTPNLGQFSQPNQNINPFHMMQGENQPYSIGQTTQRLSQPQIMLASNQPQMLNQPQTMIPQMRMHHPLVQQLPQPQLPVPKQDLPNNQDEPSNECQQGDQGMQNIKSTQEMFLELQQTMQKAQMLQQQLLMQNQLQNMMYPQPFMGPQPVAVNAGGFYNNQSNLPQVQQSSNQPSGNAVNVTPGNPQHGGMPGTHMFTMSDINNVPSLQMSTEPAIGRGSGRV